MLRTALGPAIARFLEDASVVEVMLNPDGRLWIDRLSEGLADTGNASSAWSPIMSALKSTQALRASRPSFPERGRGSRATAACLRRLQTGLYRISERHRPG